MTSPIEPMAPGERPTEPGIYMTKYERLVEIVTGADGYLWALTFGQDCACHPDRFTFIARIYPDRIEAAGGERIDRILDTNPQREKALQDLADIDRGLM